MQFCTKGILTQTKPLLSKSEKPNPHISTVAGGGRGTATDCNPAPSALTDPGKKNKKPTVTNAHQNKKDRHGNVIAIRYQGYNLRVVFVFHEVANAIQERSRFGDSPAMNACHGP